MVTMITRSVHSAVRRRGPTPWWIGAPIGVLLTALLFLSGGTTRGQEAVPAQDDLSIEQARLADRYQRLETVLGRLAELSAGTDLRRARLLREAIAKSREQDIDQRFETIVSLLEDERLSSAAERQSELRKELDELLVLLLKADRDRELDSQRQRIKKYLQEVGRLIRLQKGIRARTEGGDDANRLARDQGKVGDETGKLGDAIRETERPNVETEGDDAGDASDALKEQDPNGTPESRAGESPNDSAENGSPREDAPRGGEPKPGESAPADGSPSQPGDSPPSDSGSPPQGGRGSPSADGQPGESQQQPQQPADRAAERLRAAQERMREAQEQLEQAERDRAVREQRQALEELELAKAELERILRQLREEEMERTLMLLAARFRKMLDAQTRVYEGTVRLDRVPADQRDHTTEIGAARLSREESLIVREADRALVLLREEGSSVAFPETVSLMRDDMQHVAERLAEVKVGAFTQELEQDIIEALEETIAALDRALKDLERRQPPPGQSAAAGESAEQPLVDGLAELKMIRALQMRINRRTQRYGQLIEGEQAETAELLEAIRRLSIRQQRVYEATDDLNRGRND